MKTYIADIIPRIKQFSKKLDDLTLLENQHWVIIDETTQAKQVFIFRKNSELLIATNGRVKKGKWEYLNNDSILIEKKEGMFLLKHGFLDGDILALKLDSNNEYAIFINESKYGQDLDDIGSVEKFLRTKYLSGSSKRSEPTTDSSVPPVSLSNYSTPEYKKTFLEGLGISHGNIQAYRVNYEDGTYGFLYLTLAGTTFFENHNSYQKMYYQDFESATAALHYWKTNDDYLRKNFVKTRPLALSMDHNLENRFGSK